MYIFVCDYMGPVTSTFAHQFAWCNCGGGVMHIIRLNNKFHYAVAHCDDKPWIKQEWQAFV